MPPSRASQSSGSTPRTPRRSGSTPTLVVEMSGKGAREVSIARTWAYAADVMAVVHRDLQLPEHMEAYDYHLIGFGNLGDRPRLPLNATGMAAFGGGDLDRIHIELLPRYAARARLALLCIPPEQYGSEFWRALRARDADRLRLCLATASLPQHTAADALCGAAKVGDHDLLSFLLAAAASAVDEPDRTGATALQYAARQGHADIVRMLVDHGAAVTNADNQGTTPLHWAVHHEEIMDILLANNGDVNATDVTGSSPLHWAARANHHRAVRRAIAAGARVDARESYGCSALHWAAREGHERCVRVLVDAGADVEARDHHGWTPLHWAAREGAVKAVRALIHAGCDLVAKNDGFGAESAGMTALHLAARRGHEDVVQLLVGSICSGTIGRRARNGRTALDEAANSGHGEIVKLLRGGRRSEATCHVMPGCVVC